jgi:hypothetical protein
MTMREDRDRRLSHAEAEIDRLLGAGLLVRAPRGFADGVMARLEADRLANGSRSRAWLAAGPGQGLPLWVRMWSEPRIALALVLAAVLAWSAPWLLENAASLAGALHTGAAGGAGTAAGIAASAATSEGAWSWLADPLVVQWLGGALALVATVAALPLYHVTERWTFAAGRRAR